MPFGFGLNNSALQELRAKIGLAKNFNKFLDDLRSNPIWRL